MKHFPRVVVPLLTAATLAVPGTASAGGFSVARFGGERGHAASDHLTTIYYNPAGIALAGGNNVYVEGVFAYRRADYDRDPGAVDTPLEGDGNTGVGTPRADIDVNSGPSKLRNVLASPFIGASVDLSVIGVKGLTLGAAFYAPFGGQATWGKNENYNPEKNPTLGHRYPGGYDGAQRWAAIEGEQKSVYASAALAYATPGRRFAIGTTLSYVMSNVFLVRARNLSGKDDVLSNGEASEGRSLLDVSGGSLALSTGVMALVTPCLRVGFAYLGQPGFGEMTLDGTLVNKFGSSGSNEEAPFDVELRQTLPDTYKVGIEWNAFLRGSLRFGADYTRWSSYESQCIIQVEEGGAGKCTFKDDGSKADDAGAVLLNLPRDWEDNLALRAGGSWWPTDSLELNVGLTYDTNAVPDQHLEPAIMDSNKFIGTLGAIYEINRHLSLEGTWGSVVYMNRTTDPRPAAEDGEFPSRNPDMAGTYKQFVTYLAIGLGVHI